MRSVTVMAGGSADWGRPVRVDEECLRTWYEAYLMARFELDAGRVHYLKLRIVGIDVIANDGEVPSGTGSLEFQDADGDWLRGEVQWHRHDGTDGGTWSFSSGTGKWNGAQGLVELVLYGMPEDLDAEQPPRGPSRYFGFLEGSGALDLPNLPIG